jgi:hypothetical protein
LTIADYARREGISVATVRRRIHSGTLVAVKEPTASGFQYWIPVEKEPAHAEQAVPTQVDTHEGTQSDTQTSSHDQTADYAVAQRLEDEVVWLREQLEVRNDELREMRRLLFAATTRDRDALPAEVRSAPASVPTSRRSLWDMVRRWLSGS